MIWNDMTIKLRSGRYGDLVRKCSFLPIRFNSISALDSRKLLFWSVRYATWIN